MKLQNYIGDGLKVADNGRNYTPLPNAKREHVARHLEMVRELKQLVSTETAMDV